MRFVVARRSDGGIVAVLDACRVCYLNNLGYRISRNGLLCRFCGNRYPIDSLSVGKLSCLPFKLPFEENHGLLKIRTSDLKANAGFFPEQPITDLVVSSAFGWCMRLAGGHEMRVAGAAQGRPYANNR